MHDVSNATWIGVLQRFWEMPGNFAVWRLVTLFLSQIFRILFDIQIINYCVCKCIFVNVQCSILEVSVHVQKCI